MNKDIINGKWEEIKGKLKQQWGNFTDDEITKMQGTHEELQGFLQKKYGYQKDTAKQEIDNFIKVNGWNE